MNKARGGKSGREKKRLKRERTTVEHEVMVTLKNTSGLLPVRGRLKVKIKQLMDPVKKRNTSKGALAPTSDYAKPCNKY